MFEPTVTPDDLSKNRSFPRAVLTQKANCATLAHRCHELSKRILEGWSNKGVRS